MTKETVPTGDGWRTEPPRKHRRRRSLLEELARAGESAGKLARGHVELAKLEAREEVRKTAMDGGLGLGALPLAFAGLLMLDVALALGIASWLGAAWSFLIVGLLNLAIAGTLAVFAAARVRKQPRMEVLRTELERNRAMMRSLGARLRTGSQPQAASYPMGSPRYPAPGGDGAAHPEAYPEGRGFVEERQSLR